MRAFEIVVLALPVGLAAACGSNIGSGPCAGADPDPACEIQCSSDAQCPTGFHCGPDGTCTAECDADGTGCGSGQACDDRGHCVSSDSDGGDNLAACKKVDLLISIDPSGSMSEELDALRDPVFPLLADRLLSIADGLEDFRVAVIDSCPDPANFHTRGHDTGDCNFESGQAWMDSNSPDLVAEFTCVGDLNTRDLNCSGSNDDERPAQAAAIALEPPWIQNENAGFLRDDAPLGIMAITDEDEQPIPDATAQELFDRIVAVKGDVRKIVFIGIGGQPPDGCGSGAYGSAKAAQKLNDVTELFIAEQRGVWHDLCVGNIEDSLDEMVAVLETACDELPQID